MPLAAPLSTNPDCTIHLNERLPSVDADIIVHEGDLDPESRVATVVIRRTAADSDGPAYAIDYRDGTRFVLTRDEIWCTWTSDSTPQDAATYLLGPILAYLLRLRGTLALHASGVCLGGKAFLIAGNAGHGKSTTATQFARRGVTAITDDVAPIVWRDGVSFVLPGYPRLRLWSDVAASMFGAPDALPLLTPTWTKRFVDLTAGDYRFATAAAPLGGIFFLAGRNATPSMREVHGHEAAIALLKHASMTHALDRSMRERELAQVTELASSVPVRELIAPDDLSRAGEVCDLIEEAVR
ncbi:MAG TPA: hypothetical protein VGF69_24360 [Thermoanaerobaculia bacterium]